MATTSPPTLFQHQPTNQWFSSASLSCYSSKSPWHSSWVSAERLLNAPLYSTPTTTASFRCWWTWCHASCPIRTLSNTQPLPWSQKESTSFSHNPNASNNTCEISRRPSVKHNRSGRDNKARTFHSYSARSFKVWWRRQWGNNNNNNHNSHRAVVVMTRVVRGVRREIQHPLRRRRRLPIRRPPPPTQLLQWSCSMCRRYRGTTTTSASKPTD